MRLAVWSVVLVLGTASLASAQRCEDDALSEAAAALLLSAPHDPSGDEVLDAARAAGSDAPTAHALAIHDGNEARVGPWLARLGQRLHAPVACGQARRDERVLVIAAPRAGRLIEDGERLRVETAPGFVDPMLFVEDGAGSVERVELVDGFADLPSGLEPPLRVQLVARGPDGPRPIAERELGPARGRGPGVPELGDDPLETRVAALRERAGSAALRPHRILATVAEAHAQHVCRVGRAAHELEPGRDPRARARARGVEARHVGEVVARGRDVAAAFDALTRSPSHRSALVDRRFTDAGAGIATDAAGRACVVVVLAAWPRLVVGD